MDNNLFKAYQQGIKETHKNKQYYPLSPGGRGIKGEGKHYYHPHPDLPPSRGKEFENKLFSTFSQHYKQLTSLSRKARRTLQKKWKHSLAGIAIILALGGSPAIGATINVDANAVDNMVNGNCSIVEAITTANTDVQVDNCIRNGANGADDIILPPGSDFGLYNNDNTTYGRTGLPVINSEITIEGNGSTIRRLPGLNPTFRLFAVNAGGNLTLIETIVSDGIAAGTSDTIEEDGGGILNYGETLTITDSSITGNSANGTYSDGGGIFNYYGELTVSGSTISGNTANGDLANGGGINTYGNATITDTTFSMNTAYNFGGGIEIVGANNLTISNSTFTGNTAGAGNGEGFGGGIDILDSVVEITGSTISNNNAFYGAGVALYSEGSTSNVTITNSTISGNVASQNGIYGGNGGGVYIESSEDYESEITITNTTITDNEAEVDGGGISNLGFYAELAITNSTISGNMSADDGGGIYNLFGTATITGSTISGNTANDDGGGIFNNSIATITNSIVSGNSAGDDGDEVYNLVTFTDDSFNIFGHSGLTNAQAFDGFAPPGGNDINATQDGTNTLLSNILNTTLANNGGPTQTHALPTGSPAIDGVLMGCTLNEDQRGFPRPFNTNCDIGAFEAQPISTAKVTKITVPPGLTGFNFEVSRMGDPTIILTQFTLDDAQMDSTIIPTGAITIREEIPPDFVLDIECTQPDNVTIDNAAGTVDATIMSSAEMLDCIFTNRLQTGGGGTGGGGGGMMDEDIDIIPGDNGVFAEISISSGIPGGGSIFIDLPDEVLALAASLVPNIASCEILGSQTANIEDADVVCDIEDFPFEIDVILNLCRQGNVSGVANAVVEVISEDRPEENTEETIEILLNDLELCQATGDGDGDEEPEPGGDGDSSSGDDGGGSGCSIAPSNTTNSSIIFVTLLSVVAGIAGMFFRRRKDKIQDRC